MKLKKLLDLIATKYSILFCKWWEMKDDSCSFVILGVISVNRDAVVPTQLVS